MSYTVSLDNFSGPMDLLLFLVKQEEVEINEIPIAVICDRYLGYMKALESLDVDVASEFLVMASTLMLIKSRTLLPIDEEVDLDEELNPEDELIQQLLEYKRFKMATRDLADLATERSQAFPFRPPRKAGEQEIELEEIDVVDLVRVFATLLHETGLDNRSRFISLEKSIREYVEEVFALIRERKSVTFEDLFKQQKTRADVIARFLALLELIRRSRVRAIQTGSSKNIEVVLADDRDLSETELDLVESELSSAGEEPWEAEEAAATIDRVTPGSGHSVPTHEGVSAAKKSVEKMMRADESSSAN